jgi:uncharacterized protein YbbC (DUF1343 family)
MTVSAWPIVKVGLEVLCERDLDGAWKGKRVGLLTHAAAVDRSLKPSFEVIKARKSIQLVALFAPEHGLDGAIHAGDDVADGSHRSIPVHSLHGPRRRPTEQMMRSIDVLLVDLQDVGLRYYTYASTLFYCMEEAAKYGVEVVVLDRPNPISGLLVDGPMLEEKYRSFVGYSNTALCHGMTIGELARFFAAEYHIPCHLRVIGMEGWKRSMSFGQTGRFWVPPSPNIPEPDTPIYYAITGAIGEVGLANIGVGFTMPFKVIGAPWIQGQQLSQRLTQLKLPGIRFRPIHYKPFYGKFKDELCQGVQLMITDARILRPTQICYALLSALKELYPKQVEEALTKCSDDRKQMFCKVLGTDAVLQLALKEKTPYPKLVAIHHGQRQDFVVKRKKALLSQYD